MGGYSRISATFSVSALVEGRILFSLYVAITALELLAIVVMAVLTLITLVDISKVKFELIHEAKAITVSLQESVISYM